MSRKNSNNNDNMEATQEEMELNTQTQGKEKDAMEDIVTINALSDQGFVLTEKEVVDETVKQMDYRGKTKCKTNELKAAKYNPPSRTMNSVPLRRLKESIKEIGILIPILITPEGEIIDGHKRWTIAKELGMVEVPVMVTDKMPGDVYMAVNDTAKPLGPTEWMVVYLRGGEVPPRHKDSLEELEVVIGRPGIQAMTERRLSPHVVKIARRLSNYLGRPDDPQYVDTCIKWLVKWAQGWKVKRAMDQTVNESLLKEAIEKDRPVRFDYAIG